MKTLGQATAFSLLLTVMTKGEVQKLKGWGGGVWIFKEGLEDLSRIIFTLVAMLAWIPPHPHMLIQFDFFSFKL